MSHLHSLAAPPTPPSFTRSSSRSSTSHEYSSASTRRSGSDTTLNTIYSMYGSPNHQPKNRSWSPSDHQLLSTHLERPEPVSTSRASTATSASSELPYVTPDSDFDDLNKSPRPPRSQNPLPPIPHAAPHQAGKVDSTSTRSNHLSSTQGVSETSRRHANAPPVHALLGSPLLQKPIPPTPPESPIPSTDIDAISPPSNVVSPPAEDPDAYFVRHTYAQLDATGVPGDGYEEGIERTRARLHADSGPMKPPPARKSVNRAELAVLSRLDRYGFFSEIENSADRRVLLPRTKPLAIYREKSSSISPTPASLGDVPLPAPRNEERRLRKWERMILPVSRNSDRWRLNPLKERKLRERVYKGIPDAWRSAAWDVLMSRHGRSQSGDYQALLEMPSEYDIQIDLDVPRTISGHVLFHTRYGLGQRSLFHVLHAFSLHCSVCGYCQGMGPLAATFLCYVGVEKAHDWMCQLHDNYSMDKIFRPGFPGLLENIYVQERIMERYMPGVYEILKTNFISTTSYATKWYITLFANTVPFQTQLRLWDAFLLDGMDVIVLMAVAIVWTLKEHLLSSQASFETILSLLSRFVVPESEDDLMRWLVNAMDDKSIREAMVSWRKDWSRLVEQGEGGSALL